MKSLFTTQGCTVLITGATAGLGAEFARQLAVTASRIILVGRREERLTELTRSLRSVRPDLLMDLFKADLALASERERLAAWVVREQVPLNFLINNAGLGDLGCFDQGSWERIATMLEVNVIALTHLTHLLLPMLRAQHASAILNVSSVAGFYPLPDMAAYAASKAYVTSFSEALRIELAEEGIIVTALCPGPVPTEFYQVASRPGETICAMDRTHPALSTSPEMVVREALQGVTHNRPRVIPNRLLSMLVRGSQMLPFPIIRTSIRLGAGPKKPKKIACD